MLRQQNDWVDGWVGLENGQLYCIHADIVGGLEKVQNYADLIYGLSHINNGQKLYFQVLGSLYNYAYVHRSSRYGKNKMLILICDFDIFQSLPIIN